MGQNYPKPKVNRLFKRPFGKAACPQWCLINYLGSTCLKGKDSLTEINAFYELKFRELKIGEKDMRNRILLNKW